MIVQVVNAGSGANDEFSLLIPGGGVGDFNACATQWGSGTNLGSPYGGFWTDCVGDKTCIQSRCATAFATRPTLLAGCTWFTSWFNAAGTPKLKYQQVACPSAITAKSGMAG
jgi:hypothetical protein